ncbi:hypothetical protein Hypma_005724 [Hypsizygus marmoreus]|uniref:Uncharacterized protein n=1 Tax=Hypsizygus marmoreus TaxID=39966 RepID=A0A369KFT6_HYPMA|nr:hypothetical protein Hypma_005724 [Hypsizygus marmoreus]
MTALLRRASLDLSMSRAAQRKQRLLEIENEQRIEEAEALKMTEEQRQTLLRSFTSVKVEFSDLDGLTWHAHAHATTTARISAPPAFVILTNADLASFSPEDTIRASASRSRPRASHSHSSPSLSSSSSSHKSSPHATLRARHPRRPRSPFKGLFPPPSSSPTDPTYDSDCDRTVRADSGSDSDAVEAGAPLRKERKKMREKRVRGTSLIKRKAPPSLVASPPSSSSPSGILSSPSAPAYITYSSQSPRLSDAAPSPTIP